MLELVTRSLSNLLERFHHSTVFYLLLAPDWHIPFQAYILPPVLLTLVLVLQVSCVCLPCAHVHCFMITPSTKLSQARLKLSQACLKLMLLKLSPEYTVQHCNTLMGEPALQAAEMSTRLCKIEGEQAQGSWLVAAKTVSLAACVYIMLIQVLNRSAALVCYWMVEREVISACHFSLITVVPAVFLAVMIQLALPAVQKLVHNDHCHCIQTTALAAIAAQCCALASLDWASAYLVLIFVVPIYKLQNITGVEVLGLLSLPLHYVASLVYTAH